ncbi:hypothetical protein F4809DRAFT_590673 [Biscogniauxia mediterranea]|nr:hypothetical protein F4809DRAFT_590673 [Biscogniauxia mediterranea]
MANFYEEVNTSAKALGMLNAYLDVIVHKDPGLKFLEIGGGRWCYNPDDSRHQERILTLEDTSLCSRLSRTPCLLESIWLQS